MNDFIPKTQAALLRAIRNWRHTLAAIRNTVFAGIVVAIPLIVTIWVLNLAFGFVTGISEPFLRKVGFEIPGLGFIVSILLLFALGLLATNVLGQRVLEGVEKLLLRVPVVATIYAGVKQVIDSFKAFNNAANFKRVVYIEYPSPGCKLIGFVTGQFYDAALQREMTAVAIPTAPNPMTGLVVIVESDKLIESALTIEEATKLIVSAGLVAPKRRPAA